MQQIFSRFLIITSLLSLIACGGGGSSTPAAADPVADTTAPFVSSANPTDGSVVSELTSIELTFSEDVTGADVFGNYALSGTGIGTLVLDSVSYVDQIATLSITGLVNNGSIVINLNNIVDLADNALPAYTLTLTGTTISPTQSASPASGTNNLTALSTVEITYSKEMQNEVTDPANYILSGTAAGSLNLDTVALKSGTTSTYILTFSGTPTDGSLDIDISSITDLLGNALAGTNINYTFDVTAPQISTTAPADATLLNAAPASITVNYSEAVNGKDLIANYALSGTGIGGVSITNVVSASSQSSTVYLSGTAAEGALTLTISNITDPAGNALTGSNSITINIDPVYPTRSWTPVDGTTLNALSTATVTYSEPVLNGDNVSSYSLIGNSKGTLAIESIVNDPAGSDVYVLTISGSPVENAQYKDVSIVAGFPTVTDLVGNGVSSQIHWIVDQTSPTLLSITPENSAGIALTELSNVRVEFSETMSTDVTNPANYSLTGAGVGSLTVGTPVLVSGNIYDVPLTGAPAAGDVTLDITPTDVVGNAAAGSITYAFVTQATITSRTSGVTGTLVSVATNGSRIITVASDSATTSQSTDGGATWGAVNALTCGTGLDEIIYSGGKWITIGGTNAGYAAACNSADGATWTSYGVTSGTTTTTFAEFRGIVHNGANYVAIGRDPSGMGTQCFHSISADAQAWPATPTNCLTLSNFSTQNGIHFANGNYFITGSTYLNGTVLSVKADITDTNIYWASKSALTSAYKVIHDGTNYLVAGANSGGTGSKATIGISADLSSWAYVSLPDINTWLYDVAYDATGGYIAVGNAGLILTSSDGTTWTQQSTVTTANLNSVVWNATNWIVVGNSGTILTVVP